MFPAVTVARNVARRGVFSHFLSLCSSSVKSRYAFSRSVMVCHYIGSRRATVCHGWLYVSSRPATFCYVVIKFFFFFFFLLRSATSIKFCQGFLR